LLLVVVACCCDGLIAACGVGLQFKRCYKRNDKPMCLAVTKFLGQLINQGVAHEVLALEMLILMLETPTDDSVEVACEFTKEVGAFLQEVAPTGLHRCVGGYDSQYLRTILRAYRSP
jgi:hypothetical protein